MKKQIRSIAGTPGISFTKSEMKIYEMEIGDVLDLSEMVVIRNIKSEDEE